MGRKKNERVEPSAEDSQPEVPAIKDRIVEFIRVKASELKPHPQNLRRHGDAQRAAMQGMLDSIGYAGACIAVKRDDGYVLLDGHLRTATTPDTLVPVLVVDLDDDESLAMLAGHDKIGEMAEWDYASVIELTGKLKEDGVELADLGWSDQELFTLMGMTPDDGGENDGDIADVTPVDVESVSLVSWVLIGVPTVRFGEISEHIDALSKMDGVSVETTTSHEK